MGVGLPEAKQLNTELEFSFTVIVLNEVLSSTKLGDSAKQGKYLERTEYFSTLLLLDLLVICKYTRVCVIIDSLSFKNELDSHEYSFSSENCKSFKTKSKF
jgi:hypothetical protein